MDTDQQRTLIKILTGPHAGAEALLDPGAYVLGADDVCDIILQDSGVAGRHMRLKLESGMIFAEQLDMPFYVGKEDSPDTIDFFSVVTLGSTQFAIGPEHGKWPELLQPALAYASPASENRRSVSTEAGGETEFPLAEEAEPDMEAPPVADGSTAGSAPSDSPLSQEKEGLAAPEPEQEDQTSKALNWFCRIKPWTIRLMVGSVVVLLLASFLISWRMTGAEDPARAPKEQRRILHEIVRDLGLKNVQIRQLEDSRWKLSGLVPALKDKERLREKLQQTEIPCVLNVLSLEGERRSVEQILTSHPSGLQFKVEDGGSLVLSGYVRDEQKLEEILSELKQDVPAITTIKVEALTADQAMKLMHGILLDLKVSQYIAFAPDNEHIAAQGNVTEEIYALWKQAMDIFREKTKQPVEFSEQFKRASVAAEVNTGIDPSQALQGMTVVSVSFKPLKYFTTSAGERYFLGARLENGFTLKDITPRHLMVAKNGKTALYPLGGKQ